MVVAVRRLLLFPGRGWGCCGTVLVLVLALALGGCGRRIGGLFGGLHGVVVLGEEERCDMIMRC